MVEVPRSALIIGYSLIFDEPGPQTREERLELIKHIPKTFLIGELASLNYRLRPFDSLEYSLDIKQQQEELFHFCGEDVQLFSAYNQKVSEIDVDLQNKGDQALIFNRPANLFALQEIISFGTDLPFEGCTLRGEWNNILKYYFAVNEKVGEFLPNDEENFSLLENLTAGQLFTNTLSVVNNPFLSFERFIKIVQYFRGSQEFAPYFADYFRPAGFNPEDYLYVLGALFTNLKSKPTKFACFYGITSEFAKDLKVINVLSDRTNFYQKHDYDLTDLKKYPFYKVSENRFILLDLGFLIDKSYQIFIYDFFFKYLQPNGFTFDYYASKIGLFFENYVSNLLKYAFSDLNVIVKSLDELKVNLSEGEVELADYYIREGDKIIIGQVKASGLNAEQNQGIAETLFSGSKDFYKDFGLKQILKSLQYLNSIPTEFENDIPDHQLEIFPTIVLNDVLCSTPIMPMLFQNKLEELLSNQVFSNIVIRPITLINIQDLELLTYNIKNHETNIWQVLNENYVDALFPRPFNITLNRQGINAGKYKYSTDELARFMGLE